MKANYFKIGLFVISGVVIAIIGVIIFGAGALFRHEIQVETYFEESVQGLGVGSPITFRGVPVGNVSTITLTGNMYNTGKRYALVRSSLLTDVFQLKGDENEALQKEAANGLRVRLALQGLTGAVYLEMDYVDPQTESAIKVDWEPRYPYIPSVPSTVTRVADALDGIMRELGQIKLQQITKDLGSSLNVLSSVLQGVDLRGIGKESQQLLAEMRETNSKISKLFSGDLEASLEQFQGTFRRLSALISGRQQDIDITLRNFRAASENLREITENAKRYPSQLFFGEPPSPSR